MKHVHTYERVTKPSAHATWRCSDPGCPPRKFSQEYIVGKYCICYNCRSQFILSREDLRRKKPVCIRCSNTASAIAAIKVSDSVKGIAEAFLGEI